MHCPSVSLKIDFICHDVVSYERAQKIFFPDVKDLHPFFPCKCNFYIYKYCPIFPPQSTADTPHQLYIPHQPFLYPLWFNMLPSLSPKMLLLPLLAILALSLMDMPAAYEARRIPHGEEPNLMKKKNQLLGSLVVQGQLPPISVFMSNPPTTTGDTPPSWISHKAFANDPSLRRQLLKGPVMPSAPNPSTNIPSPTSTMESDNAEPMVGSLQKSPPPPLMPYKGTSIP